MCIEHNSRITITKFSSYTFRQHLRNTAGAIEE